MKFVFGQKAGSYVQPVIDEDDVWIKTFRPGETRVRFLEVTGEWITYREHFDPGLRKSYPCTEDTSSCMGCTSDLERVRQRPRKFAFNALDDKGRLNVYKIGNKLKVRLEGREQRQKTLLDRDYTIIRTGTTMDTTDYDFEYGDRYDIVFDKDLHNIQQILASQYLQAIETAGGQEDLSTDAAHDEPVAPKKAKAAPKVVEDEEPEEKPKAKVAPKPTEDEEPFDEWPLSRLKAYLNANDVEFPERASRATLVGLANAS
jgi:hypothetical protein